jgi:hypothetical protein
MPRKKFDYDLLKTLISDSTLINSSDEHFTRDTIINFICKCGKTDKRKFNNIYKTGNCNCNTCMVANAVLKAKDTFIKNYGVSNPNKNKEIVDKRKNTIFDKYGVIHTSQLDEIKEKKKITCLKNHGVSNPSKSQEIQNKKKITNLEKFGFEYNLQSPEIRNKIKVTIKKKYDVEYISQVPSIKEKVKNTVFEKYGFNNVSQVDIFKNKKIETCLNNYGVKWALESNIIKEKAIKTMMDKYNVDNPSKSIIFQNKKIQTNLDRLGVEWPLSSQLIRDKGIETCLIKYGCKNPMQHPDIINKSQKNSFKLKPYILPSGLEIVLQGYEDKALDILTKIYCEDDIITERRNVPELWWSYPDDNKQHRHFVDIYIKSTNTCIEIKSNWTFEQNKEKTLLKQKFAINLGYNYEIWILDHLGNILNKI